MTNWIKSPWFVNLVSTLREALAEVRESVDDPVCRMQIEALIKDAKLHKQPESLTGKVLATELAKAFTRDQLRRDVSAYVDLQACMPSLRKIKQALSAPEIHKCVEIPPDPPVMVDARIPLEQFSEVLQAQVFAIHDKDEG